MAEFETQTDEVKPFREDVFRDYLIDTIKDAIKDRAKLDLLIDSWWKDWRDMKDKKVFPWKGCANWSVPVTSTSADSIIPRLIEGIFDINPPIEVEAQSKAEKDYRDVIKRMLLWDISAHPDLMKEMWFHAQNVVWAGTSFVKNLFVKEKETKERYITGYAVDDEVLKDKGRAVKVTKEMTQILTQKGVPFEIRTDILEKRLRWKKYEPETIALYIKDVLFPSDSTSVQDAWENSLVAVRVWRSKDFLRKQLKQDDKELYKNLNRVEIKGLEAKLNSAGSSVEESRIKLYATKTRKVECFEVYGNYDLDGDGLEEKFVALVNIEKRLLFGYELYPYDHGECPIIDGFIKPIHNQAYGVGLPEMLYDSKREIDAIHNQRTDRNSLHNNPTLLHTIASGFNRNEHITGPGRQWQLSSISTEAIRYLEPPRQERQAFNEEDSILGYVQKRSGVTDYTVGQESTIPSSKTATGIMALIKEGNIGFRNFIRWMSLSVAKIMNQRLALYQQYWGTLADEDVEEWLREILDIPANPFKYEDLEAFKHKFNIVMTATKEDIQVEMTKAQAVHDILINNPLMQQFPFKMRDTLVNLLRRMGVKEPEDSVPTEEEIKQLQVEVQKEAMRQMEQENQMRNVQEAERLGFEQEKTRLGGGI